MFISKETLGILVRMMWAIIRRAKIKMTSNNLPQRSGAKVEEAGCENIFFHKILCAIYFSPYTYVILVKIYFKHVYANHICKASLKLIYISLKNSSLSEQFI